VGKHILQHCECRLVPDVPNVWPDGMGGRTRRSGGGVAEGMWWLDGKGRGG
jgi:hypothetical protein